MYENNISKDHKDETKWDLDSEQDDYKMESNMFDYEELKKGKTFGIKKYQHSIYRGELTSDDRREGYGVMVYRKGRVYEGTWNNNLR